MQTPNNENFCVASLIMLNTERQFPPPIIIYKANRLPKASNVQVLDVDGRPITYTIG